MCRGCLFVSVGDQPPAGWPLIMKIIDGEVWATSYRKSAKTHAVERSEHATCVLFVDEHTELPFVVFNGTVSVVEPTRQRVARWLDVDEPDLDSLRSTRVIDRLLIGKRVFLVVSGAPTAFLADGP